MKVITWNWFEAENNWQFLLYFFLFAFLSSLVCQMEFWKWLINNNESLWLDSKTHRIANARITAKANEFELRKKELRKKHPERGIEWTRPAQISFRLPRMNVLFVWTVGETFRSPPQWPIKNSSHLFLFIAHNSIEISAIQILLFSLYFCKASFALWSSF